MKTLKVVCMATVLALAFSVPAYAGDISTPGITTSGPVPSSQPSVPVEPGKSGPTLPISDEIDSADFFQFLLALVF
jgi:hypothetical protein